MHGQQNIKVCHLFKIVLGICRTMVFIVLFTKARYSFNILSKINVVHTLHISSRSIFISFFHLRIMPIDLSRPFKSFAPNFLVLVSRIHYKWFHCNRLARLLCFFSHIDFLYKRVWGMEIYCHNYILTPVGFSRQLRTGSHSALCVHWTKGWWNILSVRRVFE